MTSLRERVRQGQVCAGFVVSMPSVPFAQILAGAGADWLVIDMEHGPIDIASAHALIAATAGTSCRPLVRLPCEEPWVAKPVLDAGAYGIMFPMISKAAQAEATVKALRYPPVGERGWGPFYAPTRWGRPMPDYMAEANDEMLNAILIETPEAIANLEEILAVPGIDVASIAPMDLSYNLGVPGERDHPDVLAATAEAEDKILASDVALGGLVTTPEDKVAKLERGYRFLALGYDVLMIQAMAAAALEGIPR